MLDGDTTKAHRSFDRTNVVFTNFVYQIPLLKNSDNHLLKTVAGRMVTFGNRICTMESGAPLNMGVSGSNVYSVVPNSGNRPDLWLAKSPIPRRPLNG